MQASIARAITFDRDVTSDADDTAAQRRSPVLCLVDYRVAGSPHSGMCQLQGVNFGSVDVVKYEGVGVHRGHRKPHHIRTDKLSDYLVTIPLHARIDFHQAGISESIESGSFSLLSTSQPFEGSVSSLCYQEPFSALHIRVSGSLLRHRVPDVDRYCDHAFPVGRGAGHIMQQMCELALADGPALSSLQATCFGSMLVDAVANAITVPLELQALPNQCTQSSFARLWKLSIDYIASNLSHPHLDIATVAQHCNVSKRYLQAVFAASGCTVSSAIRNLRLDRCREALRNPRLSTQCVTQIAMTWGFNDLPYFSRAYKARFGRPPSEDRGSPAVGNRDPGEST